LNQIIEKKLYESYETEPNRMKLCFFNRKSFCLKTDQNRTVNTSSHSVHVIRDIGENKNFKLI